MKKLALKKMAAQGTANTPSSFFIKKEEAMTSTTSQVLI